MTAVLKYVSEFIGTFTLVFAGTGAIVVNDITGGAISLTGIALTFGLVIMVMINAVGDVSGAHFNPAVTTGFYIARRMNARLAFFFILSQVAGAFAGSLILKVTFPDHPTLGATNPTIPPFSAFVFDVILTFILMFVILNVSTGTKEKGLLAGLAVGGTVALEALFAGPITGASTNPARSLSPAIISGSQANLWLYLIAPFLGVILAVLTCKLTRKKGECSVNQ